MWSLTLLKVLPKNLISQMTGWVVEQTLPDPWRLRTLKWFAQKFDLNLEEAEKPLEEYKSINDLFTRKLKAGLRPISSPPVHPSDSQLTVAGDVHRGELLQVKGWIYSLQEFVGRSDISIYEGGKFLTYYLCPTDYHRVHSPVDGKIVWARHIPGTLWPVNAHSVSSIPKLFVKNERVVVEIETLRGPVAVVFVGATNVGKITLSFDSEVVSHRAQGRMKNFSPGIPIQAGDELGVFNMGSTVVVVYPKDFLPTTATIRLGPVRMGQGL